MLNSPILVGAGKPPLSWLTQQIPGTNMHRLNLYDFSELYLQIGKLELSENLSDSPDDRFNRAFDIMEGWSALSRVLHSARFSQAGHLPITVATQTAGSALLKASERIREEYYKFGISDATPDEGATWSAEIEMRECYKTFIAAFTTNLREINAFIMPDIGFYNINYLMEHASSRAFDSDTLPKLPKLVLEEFDSSATCLAFALPTACGFHILRANEAIMKSYMLEIGIIQAEVDACKSWCDYANKIKAKPSGKDNKEIGGAIENLRVIYRNPILHPEDILTSHEADILFGNCRTLMSAMGKHLSAPIPLPAPTVTVIS